MREIVIIFFIITIVILGTLFVDNYLKETTSILVESLEDLKGNIENKSATKEELKKKSEEINLKWDEINEKWSNIILHEEIDSIETALIRIKTKIEIENLQESKEDIETAIFFINHIKHYK